MSTEALLSVIITTLIAAIGFLLVRLIGQNDEFQKETQEEFRGVRRSIIEQEKQIADMNLNLTKKMNLMGLDPATKNKIKDLSYNLKELQEEITRLKPAIENASETTSKIIFIHERLDENERKMKGIYDIMVKMVNTPKKS